MVMNTQQMRDLMGELQERLKRLGCMALYDEMTKIEYPSPEAIRQLLDLATKAEEGPAG